METGYEHTRRPRGKARRDEGLTFFFPDLSPVLSPGL